MSIEIRQMLIKSQVLQRAGTGDGTADDEAQDEQQRQSAHDWRAECRRLIGEVLDERGER